MRKGSLPLPSTSHAQAAPIYHHNPWLRELRIGYGSSRSSGRSPYKGNSPIRDVFDGIPDVIQCRQFGLVQQSRAKEFEGPCHVVHIQVPLYTHCTSLGWSSTTSNWAHSETWKTDWSFQGAHMPSDLMCDAGTGKFPETKRLSSIVAQQSKFSARRNETQDILTQYIKLPLQISRDTLLSAQNCHLPWIRIRRAV